MALVAQIAEAVERHLHHARAKRRSDLGGAVGAVGIDDHDLVGPKHAFGRGFDLLGFVEGQDIGGDRLHDRAAVAAVDVLERMASIPAAEMAVPINVSGVSADSGNDEL